MYSIQNVQRVTLEFTSPSIINCLGFGSLLLAAPGRAGASVAPAARHMEVAGRQMWPAAKCGLQAAPCVFRAVPCVSYTSWAELGGFTAPESRERTAVQHRRGAPLCTHKKPWMMSVRAMRLLLALVLAGEPTCAAAQWRLRGIGQRSRRFPPCRVLITGPLALLIGLVLHAGTAAAQSSSKVAALYLPAGRAFDWSYAGYKGACALLPRWLAGWLAGWTPGCMIELLLQALMRVEGVCCQPQVAGAAAAQPWLRRSRLLTACCCRFAAPCCACRWGCPCGPLLPVQARLRREELRSQGRWQGRRHCSPHGAQPEWPFSAGSTVFEQAGRHTSLQICVFLAQRHMAALALRSATPRLPPYVSLSGLLLLLMLPPLPRCRLPLRRRRPSQALSSCQLAPTALASRWL
jgi:hypothetical protein